MTGVRYPAGGEDVRLLHSAHLVSCRMSILEVISPGVKRPWCEADRSPPSGAEVKNGADIRLHGVVLDQTSAYRKRKRSDGNTETDLQLCISWFGAHRLLTRQQRVQETKHRGWQNWVQVENRVMRPHNTAKRKQLDITTIQNHNKLTKGTSLRGPLRTPNNTSTFRFNIRGTQTQSTSVEDPKYWTLIRV
jgi:hypothetical protein